MQMPSLNNQILWKREDGFTLVEVLVAMAVFLIVVIAMSTFFLHSYKNVILAGKKSVTVYEAQQELEEVIADPDSSHDEDEISEEPYQITIFGKTITGTKITVEKEYDQEHNRKLSYIVFVPDAE